MNTDLIIIGAGPGGYETAVRAAKAGLQVVVIEKEHLGGTCLNAGCIPTKCLCHSAEDLPPSLSQGRGEETSSYLAEAIARKNEVVEKLKAGVAQLMKTPGITLVEGEARFVNQHTIAVGQMVNGQWSMVSGPCVVCRSRYCLYLVVHVPLPELHRRDAHGTLCRKRQLARSA